MKKYQKSNQGRANEIVCLKQSATLKPRAGDKYVEDLRTKSVIAELIGTISRNTKFKTERWQAKKLASK